MEQSTIKFIREALISSLVENDRSQGSVFDNWATNCSAIEWEEGKEDQQIHDFYGRFVDFLLNSEQFQVCVTSPFPNTTLRQLFDN